MKVKVGAASICHCLVGALRNTALGFLIRNTYLITTAKQAPPHREMQAANDLTKLRSIGSGYPQQQAENDADGSAGRTILSTSPAGNIGSNDL